MPSIGDAVPLAITVVGSLGGVWLGHLFARRAAKDDARSRHFEQLRLDRKSAYQATLSRAGDLAMYAQRVAYSDDAEYPMYPEDAHEAAVSLLMYGTEEVQRTMDNLSMSALQLGPMVQATRNGQRASATDHELDTLISMQTRQSQLVIERFQQLTALVRTEMQAMPGVDLARGSLDAPPQVAESA